MKKFWIIPVDFPSVSKRQLAAKSVLLQGGQWKKLSVSQQEDATKAVSIKHPLNEACDDKLCPYCAILKAQKVKIKADSVAAQEAPKVESVSGGEDGPKQKEEAKLAKSDGASKP